MITRFKQQITMPYSLHDMVVNNIIYKNESVYLRFEHGFVSTKEPYTQVEGKITIENVDIDSACVLLLSKLGKYGSFDGMKISLNVEQKYAGKEHAEYVNGYSERNL